MGQDLKHFKRTNPYLNFYYNQFDSHKIMDAAAGTNAELFRAWIRSRDAIDQDGAWREVDATQSLDTLKHVVSQHRGALVPLYLLISVPSPLTPTSCHSVAAVFDPLHGSLWVKDPLEGERTPKAVIDAVRHLPERMQAIRDGHLRTFPTEVLATLIEASGVDNPQVDTTPQQRHGEMECTYWSMHNLDRRRRGLPPFERFRDSEAHARMLTQLRALYGGEATHGLIKKRDAAIEHYLDECLPVFYQLARDEIGRFIMTYICFNSKQIFERFEPERGVVIQSPLVAELNAFIRDHYIEIADATEDHHFFGLSDRFREWLAVKPVRSTKLELT